MLSYEALVERVAQLQLAQAEHDRHIDWCDEREVLGIAKDPHGRIEVFLVGRPLAASRPRVQNALEFQTWYREDGGELAANRILLPDSGHYEQVAAFLCVELLRSGVSADVEGAFARSEPLLDLAIADLLMSADTLLGLCGEMFVLAALTQAAPAMTKQLLASWVGHREAGRDFQIGPCGVEVKTTTAQTSSHIFSGVHQLEVGHGVDGAFEDSLFVLSLGLEWSSAGGAGSTALPEVLDSIITRTRLALGDAAPAHIADLLTNVSSYGLPGIIGYDHLTMSEQDRFLRPFRVKFARAYDMRDPAIHLLTTEDLVERPFIDASSLRLRINLPSVVTGDVNPTHGMGPALAIVLKSGGSADLIDP